jgi:anti-sigma regulatory factor (Ser/Thr protein kinase)
MKRGGGADIKDEMTLPAGIDAIPELVTFVSAHAGEGGFEDARIKAICLAVAEALTNIVRFACADGRGEITVKCGFFENHSFLIDIIDSGKHFNMLVAGAFPETADFIEQGQTPSLKQLKKAVRSIEYRRDGSGNKNILSLVIPK